MPGLHFSTELFLSSSIFNLEKLPEKIIVHFFSEITVFSVNFKKEDSSMFFVASLLHKYLRNTSFHI